MTVLTASVKARRLLADKRVMPAGAATVYEVRGDHDTYRVILGTDWASCPCPAQRELCSHVESARLLDDALAADVLVSVNPCQRAEPRLGQVATPAGVHAAARAVPAGTPPQGQQR